MYECFTKVRKAEAYKVSLANALPVCAKINPSKPFEVKITNTSINIFTPNSNIRIDIGDYVVIFENGEVKIYDEQGFLDNFDFTVVEE